MKQFKLGLTATPNHFRFLDLPAEIRNMIYTYAVDNVPNYSSELLNAHRRELHITSDLRPRRALFREFPRKLTALLQVNRQIHVEVVPMLYGFFEWHFTTMKLLGQWLEAIGSNSTFIRHITVSRLRSTTGTAAERVFYNLSGAINLEKIVLKGTMRWELEVAFGPRGVAAALPFLKSMKQAKNDKYAGLNCFEFLLLNNANYKYELDSVVETSMREDYDKLFKREMMEKKAAKKRKGATPTSPGAGSSMATRRSRKKVKLEEESCVQDRGFLRIASDEADDVEFDDEGEDPSYYPNTRKKSR